MSKKGIDQEAIEEFFNENPNVFSSVLRNMKRKTKKSYKKLSSINQTRKTNRDYKKKKKLSPIKEVEEEKEKSKEKVCFGCLQSGGMEAKKKKSVRFGMNRLERSASGDEFRGPDYPKQVRENRKKSIKPLTISYH